MKHLPSSLYLFSIVYLFFFSWSICSKQNTQNKIEFCVFKIKIKIINKVKYIGSGQFVVCAFRLTYNQCFRFIFHSLSLLLWFSSLLCVLLYYYYFVLLLACFSVSSDAWLLAYTDNYKQPKITVHLYGPFQFEFDF